MGVIRVRVTDEQREELVGISRRAVGRVALWLPKYSAHKHSPVERVWGRMKDEVAANRLAGSIEELAAYARRFFADLSPHVAPHEAA